MCAVDERFDDDAFGQAFLYLRHAFLHILYHLLEFLTFEHQRDAGHDLTLSVPCHGSIAGGISELHVCHVPYKYRCTANGFHGYLPYVLQRRGEAYAPDEILIAVLLDVAAASVLVARFEGVIHVRYGQPRCVQPVGINRHLILLHVSAPSAYFGYALCAGELLAHNPVLHRAQVGKAVLVLVAFFCAYGVMVDFAKPGRHGGKPHRAFALRQHLLGFLQLLAHLLPRPIHIGGIVKDKRDDR